MLWLEDFLPFGCPVVAVLVLDSWTRLDTWRAMPVQTSPGYVREMRQTLAASD